MKRLIALLFGIAVAVTPADLFAQAGTAGITPCSANSISVSGSSNNVQLSLCGPVIILYNITSTELFYNYGTASTTAATTSNYSLPGNTYVVLNIGNVSATAGYLAAITASSTTTLRIIQGYARGGL